MNEKRIHMMSSLNEIFCEVFDDEEIVVTDETTAEDIDEWDSLMHVTLIVAAEKAFDVTLSAEEIGNLKSVGELIDIIVDRAV